MQHKYIKNVSTLSLDKTKCTGCGMCKEVCPHNVFAISRFATIVNKDACMECGACAKNCAMGAIKVRSGVGCAYAVLRSKKGEEESCTCDCDC